MSQLPEMLSIVQLAALTGFDRRRVSASLIAAGVSHAPGDKGAKLYKPAVALGVLYKPATDAGSAEQTLEIMMEREKLRQQRAKSEMAEIELREKRGQVVPIGEVAAEVSREYGIVRAQFRALPSAQAKHLAVMTDPQDVFDQLSKVVDDILKELQADARARAVEAQAAEVDAAANAPDPALAEAPIAPTAPPAQGGEPPAEMKMEPADLDDLMDEALEPDGRTEV